MNIEMTSPQPVKLTDTFARTDRIDRSFFEVNERNGSLGLVGWYGKHLE